MDCGVIVCWLMDKIVNGEYTNTACNTYKMRAELIHDLLNHLERSGSMDSYKERKNGKKWQKFQHLNCWMRTEQGNLLIGVRS